MDIKEETMRIKIEFDKDLPCQEHKYIQPITQSEMNEMEEMIKKCIDDNVHDPRKTIIIDSWGIESQINKEKKND